MVDFQRTNFILRANKQSLYNQLSNGFQIDISFLRPQANISHIFAFRVALSVSPALAVLANEEIKSIVLSVPGIEHN